MYASMTSKQQIEWPIFRVLPLIFLKWGYFLCLFIFSACRPIVRSVCLFYIFLLLFSNKMKVRFCFFCVKWNSLTTHTDKYRMNDVTMIYKIYRKSKLCGLHVNCQIKIITPSTWILALHTDLWAGPQIFFLSTKTYVVGTQKNRLYETVLLSTQNTCLNWYRNSMPTFLLNWSYVWVLKFVG